jgi:hypothetical protein
MNRGITTGERKNAPNGSDEERESLRRELSQVEELCKNLFRCSVIRHISQRDKNREETQNMQNQNHALKARKDFSSNAVDADREHHDCPEKKSSVPIFGLVGIVCEHD